MANHLVLFITHYTVDMPMCDQDPVETWYRFARLADVEEKHVEIARRPPFVSVAKYTDDAETWGFLYAEHDKVDKDEDVERGRMEAQRIFIAVTQTPAEFLNDSEYVVAKIYTHHAHK